LPEVETGNLITELLVRLGEVFKPQTTSEDTLRITIREVIKEEFATHNSQIGKPSDYQDYYKKINTPQVDKTDNRESVLIVGLLPRQETLIKMEFGGKYKLRFHKCEKSNNPSDVEDKVKHVHKVIGVTDFMSHSEEAAIKKCAKEGQYVRVGGGMTKLREELEHG